MSKLHAGKTALVTGASRGLGRAIAHDLAAQGALVALNYASNDAAARATLASIETNGGNAFLVKTPLGSFEAAQELADAVLGEFKERTGDSGLDYLINNAGGGPLADTDATTPEIFEKILSDNMRGPFYVTKVLKPYLRENGRVIFMSSLGARKGRATPQYVVYAMAKSGVETFTEITAKELGPRGITVNCIMPGLITSDANADIRADEAMTKYLVENTMLRRIGQPEDIAGVTMSLLSPAMGFVTAQVIEVSGGLMA